MPTPSIAAGAYANVARLTDPAGGAAKAAGDGAAGGTSFRDMLKGVLNSVTESGRKTDAQAQAMLTGKADMIDVVTAVSETAAAVQTMVAVRDKVIEAYQNIMSMPI